MTYKTILAVLRDEADCSRVLDTAIPLAELHDGHLVGIHAEPAPIDYAAPLAMPDAGFYEAAQQEAERRNAAIKKIFDERTGSAGISAEWRSTEVFSRSTSRTALPSAHCADLVITQQVDPEVEISEYGELETLLFETGRPVLFVPYAGKPVAKAKRVLVAWNGRREAARAVFDALPFIVAAEETEIFVADPEETSQQSPSMAGAGIAETLARHGAKVSVETVHSAGVPIGALIENRIADTGAELLVMGAYSHMRLRETLFGGVTKTLLNSMPAMTLMSR